MTQDLHTLAGAYALDALTDEEREEFERHLDICFACREEVGEFAATAALLGAAGEELPPPSLRQRTLAEVDRVRQLPPIAGGPSALPSRLPGLTRPLLAAVAAVLAIAVLGLGGLAFQLTDRVAELEATVVRGEGTDELLAVLGAPDAQLAPLRGDAAGRFVWSATLDQGVLLAAGLAAPPEGHVYELWLFHGGTPVPAGLFQTDEQGRAVAFVEGDVAGMEGMAVTIEPEGGNPQPTGQVVLSTT